MAYDHRGNSVFDNYRPTPRLARYMARAITRDIREGSPITHGRAPEVTPAEAQRYLNEYRVRRDKGYSEGIHSDMNQQIYNAVSRRHGGY